MQDRSLAAGCDDGVPQMVPPGRKALYLEGAGDTRWLLVAHFISPPKLRPDLSSRAFTGELRERTGEPDAALLGHAAEIGWGAEKARRERQFCALGVPEMSILRSVDFLQGVGLKAFPASPAMRAIRTNPKEGGMAGPLAVLLTFHQTRGFQTWRELSGAYSDRQENRIQTRLGTLAG